MGTSPVEVDKTLDRNSCLSQNFLSSLPILSKTLKPTLHGLFLASAVYTTTNSSSDCSRQVCLPPVISKCSKQASRHTPYPLSEVLLRALISGSGHLDNWPKARSSLWGISFLPFTKVSSATKTPVRRGLHLSLLMPSCDWWSLLFLHDPCWVSWAAPLLWALWTSALTPLLCPGFPCSQTCSYVLL